MNTQDFWRIYRHVYRRRWLVLAVLGATVGVVGLGCIFMPRYYRASAYVMPSEAALSKPVIPGAGIMPSPVGGMRSVDPRRKGELLATFIGLAKTAEVRERAITSLGLGMTPAELAESVNVEPEAGSIIRITCLSRTSEGAIALANAIAHQFAQYYQDLASYQAKRNSEFLESELGEAEREYEQVRAELQALKTSKGEAALPVGEASNPFLVQFYALRSQTDATKSELRSVEGRLSALRTEVAQQSPIKETETSTTDNPVVRGLQEELARLERDLLLAQTRYTEKHRKIKDLKTQIADVRERLSRESEGMITRRTVGPNPVYDRLREEVLNLGPERAALISRLSSLEAAMAENEQRAAELADSSVALLAKTREYENAQARHTRLNQMLDAARVEEKVSASAGEIQIVDRAQSATGPVTKRGPSRWQLLLLGVVLSVGLGLGTALGLAFLDDRVQAREDLERELELPVPAVIPELPAGIETDGVPLARITELRPLSPHAEAYRFLRTELLHQDGSGPLRTVLVATARPGQGGSTTAVNLAIALAEVGKRVVLMDADMRRPGLHEFFEENNDTGLTTLLANGSGAAAQALRRTGMENLLLLPAGPPVGNPAALLSSERMRRLLAQLREHSDYVVIDTPSAATFADAAMLGALVDGVILVTRANQRVSEAERRTKELFAKVGANVIGAVLNDASADSVDSHYFHRHYYPGPPALPAGVSGPEAGAPAAEPQARAEASGPQLTESDAGAAAPSAASETTYAGPAAPAEPAGPEAEAQTTESGRAARRPIRIVLMVAGVLAVLLATVGYFGILGGHAPQPGERLQATQAPPPAVTYPAVTVVASVKRPTNVRVERDGELLYEGPLTAGQQIWQASKEISIWASRPEAIELTVNGEALGPLGQEGDPAVSRRFRAEEGAE